MTRVAGVRPKFGVERDEDGKLVAGVRYVFAVDHAEGVDQSVETVLARCAECGAPAPLENDPELRAAGYALCDDCKARVENETVTLTDKGWAYVLNQEIRPLYDAILFDQDAIDQASAGLEEAQVALEALLSEAGLLHVPAIIIAAAEMLYWGECAVQAGDLSLRDASLMLRELAVRVHLQAEELIACALIVYRLRGGVNVPAWPEVEKAAVATYVEKHVYGVGCGA